LSLINAHGTNTLPIFGRVWAGSKEESGKGESGMGLNNWVLKGFDNSGAMSRPRRAHNTSNNSAGA